MPESKSTDAEKGKRVRANTPKFKDVRLLVLDVDGVLTDGRIVYTDQGAEIKAFHVKDGLGLRLLAAGGVDAALVTGRRSEALHHRCRDLRIDALFEGVADKANVLETLCRKKRIDTQSVAFIGDDLPDIPAMKRAGVSIAVADAHEAVRAAADLVTDSAGGAGAVREVCDAILVARGIWAQMTERFS